MIDDRLPDFQPRREAQWHSARAVVAEQAREIAPVTLTGGKICGIYGICRIDTQSGATLY